MQRSRGWPGHQQAGVAGTGNEPKSPQWRQLSVALPGSLAVGAQIRRPPGREADTETVHRDATAQGGQHGGLTRDLRAEGLLRTGAASRMKFSATG